MRHLLVHTNQDIKRRYNIDKVSTVHTTEYLANETQQLNPGDPGRRQYIRPQPSQLQESL